MAERKEKAMPFKPEWSDAWPTDSGQVGRETLGISYKEAQHAGEERVKESMLRKDSFKKAGVVVMGGVTQIRNSGQLKTLARLHSLWDAALRVGLFGMA